MALGQRQSRHRRFGLGGLGFLPALLPACAAAPAGVAPAPVLIRPGLEVLLTDSLALLRGRTIGLVTNHAAVDRSGASAVDRLLAAGVRLAALFSPEHGFRGSAEPGVSIATSRDSATGLPIYSLYGATRAPSEAMLGGIELLLVDLPDVGARYYTYLSTTIEVMRSGARFGRPVVILDRPNPIGGAVQGNVLDTAFRSFVGPLAMPMRPGLTLGELARLANQELGIRADLRVVPAEGWRRAVTQWETGLPFLPPSPNLKDLESLFHYPGLCLFEGTALSVGRGTDAPFRQIGAPWLDPARVIAALPLDRVPGVRFLPVRFTPVAPGDAKHAGVVVSGIRLVLTDPAGYDPTLAAVVLLSTVQRLYPDSIGFRTAGFDRLAGGSALREAIRGGQDPFTIAATWASARDAWMARREAVLLYRE